MKEFFTSTGRVPRSVFWCFQLCFMLLSVLISTVEEYFPPSDTAKALIGLSLLPVLGVGIIVQIKRWHDLDKSGWWVLINLAPCVGAIWTFVECGCLRGTVGPNQYGPDPLAPAGSAPPPLPPSPPPLPPG